MAISSIMGNEPAYGLVKEGINASNVRANVISNNMANINTKNYKRFNVVFEENLNKDRIDNISLRTTRDQHFTDGDSDGNITIERDNSTSMRSDGNNVDLDVEKTNQAANTLKYYALLQQASSKLSLKQYVISGGK